MNGTADTTNGLSATTNGVPAPGTQVRTRWVDEDFRRTMAAWEVFVGGRNAVEGVRPEILLSWYRCREEYRVDPELAQAPAATGRSEHSLFHDGLFAELGGLAASVAREVEELDGLITVADAGGRVLAAWGRPALLHRAEDANLAPWSTWSEWASGTNGMGTALENHEPVFVAGPEHWCQGFHEWSCGAVAIRDVLTAEPLAVLNVSRWRGALPADTGVWLRGAAERMRTRLHQCARQDGTELLAAYAGIAAHTAGPVAAVDVGGRVVVANPKAAVLLGVPADTPATDPASRRAAEIPELVTLATLAAEQAARDAHWVGSTRLFVPFLAALSDVTVRPVLVADRVVGVILAIGADDGEPTGPASSPPPRVRAPRPYPARVIGRRDRRLVLLEPHEIRFAESDGNTVWLTSDRGRLQAATQGLDNLERELAGEGFLRVHRRFLVNPRRVREVEQGFKGALFLLTDVRTRETVPVSRRHAAALRRALGV